MRWAVNSDLLPATASGLIDPDIAQLSDCAAASSAIATGKRALDGPPPEFGEIHPKRLLTTREKSAERRAPDTRPPGPGDADQDSPDEEDGEDSDGKLPALFTNVVGGQGLPARLCRRMLRLGRESEGGITGGGVPKSARALVKPGRIGTVGTGLRRQRRPSPSCGATACDTRNGTYIAVDTAKPGARYPNPILEPEATRFLQRR